MKNALSYVMVLIMMVTTTVLPLYYLHMFEQEADIQTSHNLYQYSQGNHLELNIKVPISLPYTEEWDKSKEANGLIEYKGEYYTVISKKYENDTLYFKCIQNINARDIFMTLTDHVEKNVKGSPSKENNKTQLVLIFKIISNKIEEFNHHFLSQSFCFLNKARANDTYSNAYKSSKTDFNAPPPRLS